MAPDNLDGKAGANGRPFEGATLRLHRIIRETMAAGDMQRHGDTTARRHGAVPVQRAPRLTTVRKHSWKLNDTSNRFPCRDFGKTIGQKYTIARWRRSVRIERRNSMEKHRVRRGHSNDDCLWKNIFRELLQRTWIIFRDQHKDRSKNHIRT